MKNVDYKELLSKILVLIENEDGWDIPFMAENSKKFSPEEVEALKLIINAH